MSKKKPSKKPAHVVTTEETLALARRASLRRAVGIERTVKALTKSLDKLRAKNALDLLGFASKVATDAGFILMRPTEEA
jgi:hypothetical protein